MTGYTEIVDPSNIMTDTESVVVDRTGVYSITALTTWAADTNGARFIGYHVGTYVSGAPTRILSTGGAILGDSTIVGGSSYVSLTAGDRITIVGKQNSGSAINATRTRMAVNYIGPIA